MARKKTEVSEQERQRRARQAAQQSGTGNDPKALGPGFKNDSGAGGGFHPSALVQKHQKKTGRGP